MKYIRKEVYILKIVYADHAATTKIKNEVLEAMLPYLKDEYGNPSAAYKIAENNKLAIEKAREQVKIAIGAENKEEIYFTSGGSESDNLAIKGVAKAKKNIGKHIILKNAIATPKPVDLLNL